MKSMNEIIADTMTANMDENVIIKLRDAMAYHLKVESRAINPNDPTHPVIRRRIMVLRPIDYQKYFQCSTDDQIGYLKAMAIENVKLVHDPCLNSKELNEQIEDMRPKPTQAMIEKVEFIKKEKERRLLKPA